MSAELHRNGLEYPRYLIENAKKKQAVIHAFVLFLLIRLIVKTSLCRRKIKKKVWQTTEHVATGLAQAERQNKTDHNNFKRLSAIDQKLGIHSNWFTMLIYLHPKFFFK